MMSGRVTRSRNQLAQQAGEQWTNELTKIFAELLVEQVRRGNRISSNNNISFSERTWKAVCDGFYQKTGLNWDKERFKNRYAAMRREFAIVNSILGRSEFSMDESTGMIVGSSEAWDEYLKGYPDAERIKTSGFPIYKQLCVIFSGLLTEIETNGRDEQYAKRDGDMTTTVSGKEPLSVEPLNVVQLEDSTSESEEVDEMADQYAFQAAMRRANAKRKKGRGVDGAIAAAILQMAAAANVRTAAVRQLNARYSIADCIKELDKMQGVEQDVYFAALDLFNKPNAREFFLSLKGDKRLTWLRGKCSAHSHAMP